MSKLLSYYEQKIEHLTSYTPAILFTSDTPNAKQKKQEARCIKIVDSFYNYTNYTYLREALRCVQTDFLLGCNRFIEDELLHDVGRLQAILEHLSKQIEQSVKGEPCLKQYYQTKLQDVQFSTVFEELLTLLANNNSGINVDTKHMKTVYYNSYKQEKKTLKEVWK